MTTQSHSGGHTPPEQPRRTQAVRFREIRDAIMAQSNRMKPTRDCRPAGRELRCGPFRITFYPPGAWGPGRGYNLNIWRGAKVDGGHLVSSQKVANVDWDQRDNVDILTFRSGVWERELLSLLRDEGNVLPFG
ncbi:MAG: hypothetical protein Q8R44_01525 [Novosphingobium sp.]|nr:hypothetical protein [Novosphingobium sp.]